jgi:hypothetical protein
MGTSSFPRYSYESLALLSRYRGFPDGDGEGVDFRIRNICLLPLIAGQAFLWIIPGVLR